MVQPKDTDKVPMNAEDNESSADNIESHQNKAQIMLLTPILHQPQPLLF